MVRVVRVIPDIPALDKAFDYQVPASSGDLGRFEGIQVGTMVRIVFHGRRVGGWVVADGVEPPSGVTLKSLSKVTGMGPSAELIDLSQWAAWRWAGRSVHFLRASSPPRAVKCLPTIDDDVAPINKSLASLPIDEMASSALADGSSLVSVLRLPPSDNPIGVVVAAAKRGTTLVVTASHAMARSLARQLREANIATALMPDDWASAAAGARVVIGARGASWAPAVELACVVVVDEHDEALQEESAPTWHAREVSVERARRVGVPCLLVSPCPSLEALALGPLSVASRSRERAGWPIVDVIDRRREEPRRVDLYSSQLVELIHRALNDSDSSPHRVLCVLNRKGRARLLACGSCAELARCHSCGAAMISVDENLLSCPRCAEVRPMVCVDCGSGRLKVLRPGVSRVREELETLLRVQVGEITGEFRADEPLGDAPVLVGTEAVLHRVARANLVAFLDLDSSLLAAHHRAGEVTFALLARAARVLGGKHRGGRLVLQTRVPTHEVIQAALHADPSQLSVIEAATRAALRLPPEVAMAELSGIGANQYADALRSAPGVQVIGPIRDRYLVQASDHPTLCNSLATTPRPSARLRVAVDPPRL